MTNYSGRYKRCVLVVFLFLELLFTNPVFLLTLRVLNPLCWYCNLIGGANHSACSVESWDQGWNNGTRVRTRKLELFSALAGLGTPPQLRDRHFLLHSLHITRCSF